MFNFKIWMEEIESTLPPVYIDPDKVYFSDKVGRMAFIYTKENKIYYGKHTHGDIVNQIPDLQNYFRINKISTTNRDYAANKMLFGRVGKMDAAITATPYDNLSYPQNVKLVSFWGNNPLLFNEYLKPCLTRLQKDGLIDMNRDILSTVNHKTVYIKDLFNAGNASDKDIEQQKQQFALHLMGAQEKKKELAKRGFTGSPQSPYQVAAQNAGITRPGQSIYGLHSDWNLF